MSSIPLQTSATEESVLLAELGISLPRTIVCRVEEAFTIAALACAELPGRRVVLKVAKPFIAHKTEVGAVRVVEKSEAAIVAGVEDFALRLDASEVAVTEFIEHDLEPGGELLLAIRWTAELGPIVTFGLGGVAAEVLANVAVLAPGLATDPAVALAGKAFTPLITGFRNQRPRISGPQLRELLDRCVAFAASRLPHDLNEIEINPLVPTAGGLYALDVLIAPAQKSAAALATAPRPNWKIDKLLHPKSVAVMGVSSTSMNAGRIIANNARPRATIVKQGSTEIDGVRCVPDLESLEPVDLLVLSIAAEQVPEVVEQAVATQKAESIVVIPGGLGEYEGSENLEQRVRDALAASRDTAWGGPVVNGANCLGVLSPDVNTIFLPREKYIVEGGRTVPLAIVSQSGALAVSLQTKLAPDVPRYVISLGNQLDLTVSDYLQYFAREGTCEVLSFYVEGFEPLDGRRWFEIADRVVRGGRDVVLYRAGRTPAGQKATSSHTASIAGDVVVARELARATGVLFAESLDEFTDLTRLALLLRGRQPRGLRLGAMSNAGFETVAMADNLGPFELATLGNATREDIGRVIRESRLDRIVTVGNPLDVNPMLGDTAFARLAELLLADDGVDAAVIGAIPLTGALRTLPYEAEDPASVVNLLTGLWRRTTKPWAVVIDSGALYDATAQRLDDGGVPVFRSADRAVRALGKWSATLLRA